MHKRRSKQSKNSIKKKLSTFFSGLQLNTFIKGIVYIALQHIENRREEGWVRGKSYKSATQILQIRNANPTNPQRTFFAL
jgi:hypothetical protein